MHRHSNPRAERTRILLICDGFLKDTAHLALALGDYDVELALLCSNQTAEFENLDERRTALEPVLRADVPVIEIDWSLRRLAPQWHALRALMRAARWKPHVIFAQNNRDPRFLLMTLVAPTILNVHDPSPHPDQPAPPWYRRPVLAAWRRRATLITVHGEALREEYLQKYPSSRVASWPLGIVPRAEPAAIPSRPTVLFFGRLNEYKGLDVLLDAMKHVWNVRPEVRLIVAGRGPMQAIVPRDPRISARFGYVPEGSVDAVFAEATILALPYRHASQSGPGGRALERGIPVVASSIGGLPELVGNPARLFPPGNPTALADRILVALDHDLAERRQILSDASDRMSWHSAAARLLDLIGADRGLWPGEPAERDRIETVEPL